jgi:multisubunit Na+/H+ antiporter MnhC subunit
MNNLVFTAIIITTCMTIFYLGYLFGKDTEQDRQKYAKRIRDDHASK